MVDIDALKQLYKFSKHLSLSDANDLIKAAKRKSFEKKEIILKEGSSKKEILFVRKGLIRQYLINEKGEEITFRLIPENYVMANVDVILFNQASRFHYEAFEKTKTFSVDYNVVQEIISNNPKLQENRVQFSHRMMSEMHRRIELFVLHTPEDRYLKFVEEHPEISNRVPDKYIANVLGITPVSLSRIRARISKH
jgi:CRP-like cAMP-binding protein